MNALDEYHRLLGIDTDMKLHLPLLKGFAKGVRVTEFGTRGGISATALIAGRPISCAFYDKDGIADNVVQMCQQARVYAEFHAVDLSTVKRIDETDFLFIDAMHNGSDVAHYLKLGREAGASVMALHDTEIFGRRGDVEGTPGILDAVDAMLALHQNWIITYQTAACFGLTVLSKKP